ncbi:Uncharacterized protein DBV15_11030 [Temnothorax longispinosus]|uniref:Uncharacterized protein n=1 Tax=Temnothorax longispinosus TaxID=300112 RepID=A0A4S2KML3_9HYME|nr:Uncharacterized protein DBV15_11030 [Temnothorax longispinosus]
MPCAVRGSIFSSLLMWGPTFPVSKLELALISVSRIAPDSMPSGAMHWAATNERDVAEVKASFGFICASLL